MRAFLFFVMLTGFCINAEYSITRPVSNSLILTLFSSDMLPWIWLATVPLNLLVIILYNRFLPIIGPMKVLGILAFVTIGVNVITPFIIDIFPTWALIQFAWKDIYVLLMFKQLWSLIHSTVVAPKAKYLYGLIYAMGTLGAIIGGLIPSFLAIQIGSNRLFFFTLPIYMLLCFSYRKAFQYSEIQNKNFHLELPSKKSFSLITQSPLLFSILALVVLMQVSIALMEFQFNIHLEQTILNFDLRTQYVGRMHFLTSLCSGLLQIIGSFLMVRTIGVQKSHLAIPFLFLANVISFFFIPSFALISCSLIFMKAVDFSLFGVIREMLYIPLKLEEKFRAKAIIDVFAYRTSKALVAFCILGLGLFAENKLLPWINSTLVAVLLLWMAIVWFLLKKHYPKNGEWAHQENAK